MKLEDLGISNQQIIDSLVDNLQSDARENVISEVRSSITKAIQAEITVIVARVIQEETCKTFDSVFQPVDPWGEKTGEPTTIREIFRQRCKDWWSQKVDREGKPMTSSYGRDSAPTMANWHAENAMKEIVSKEFPAQMGELIKETKAALGLAMTQQVHAIVQRTLAK